MVVGIGKVVEGFKAAHGWATRLCSTDAANRHRLLKVAVPAAFQLHVPERTEAGLSTIESILDSEIALARKDRTYLFSSQTYQVLSGIRHKEVMALLIEGIDQLLEGATPGHGNTGAYLNLKSQCQRIDRKLYLLNGLLPVYDHENDITLYCLDRAVKHGKSLTSQTLKMRMDALRVEFHGKTAELCVDAMRISARLPGRDLTHEERRALCVSLHEVVNTIIKRDWPADCKADKQFMSRCVMGAVHKCMDPNYLRSAEELITLLREKIILVSNSARAASCSSV